MNTVHIDNIKEGMVLADDVRDIASRLLLSKGIRIQPKHLRVFKIWGITEVFIEGRARVVEDPGESISDERIQQVLEETKTIFKHQDLDHSAIKELFRHSVFHRSQNRVPAPEKFLDKDLSDALQCRVKCNLKTKLNGSEIKLPEIPSTISELNNVIATPLTSASDIAQIVNKSPSLVSVLLKIVNSAIYCFPSQIDSISRAVTLIGSKEIYSLAVGVTVMSMFRDIPKQFVDMSSFLRHSLACGIISRILAARKNFQHTEQLFVSGLLHDIGRLILYKYFPEEAKRLILYAAASENSLYQVENKMLDCRHTDIAKHLLTKWKLPSQLADSVFYHHNPSAARDSANAAIVHMADIIVNGMGIGSSGEKFVPPFDAAAWDRLQFPPGIFKGVIRQAMHQLTSLENFLTTEN
jgi:putative nucleotidyltransferase with HDIG domain